jgi:hypothetical protein
VLCLLYIFYLICFDHIRMQVFSIPISIETIKGYHQFYKQNPF